jgi:hypothetical protein
METKARATASVAVRGLAGVTLTLGVAVGSAAVANADPVMDLHIKGSGVCELVGAIPVIGRIAVPDCKKIPVPPAAGLPLPTIPTPTTVEIRR